MTTDRRDQGDLGNQARALVDAGRALDDPQAADRARVRSRLAAALGASTALTAATKAGVAAAKSGGIWATSSALGAKLLGPALVAVALSAAAGAVVWTQSSGGPANHRSPAIRAAAPRPSPTAARAPAVAPPPSRATAATDREVAAPPATTASPNPGSAPLLARPNPGSAPLLVGPSTRRAQSARQMPARRSKASDAPISPGTLASPSAPTTEARAETAVSEGPTQEETRARVQPPQPTPASEAPPAVSTPQPASNAQRSTRAQASTQPEAPPHAAAVHAPALAGELRLLGAAQRALSNKQFARALALLDEHASRYPTGSLVPERLAARAVVLCRMDRVSAGLSELQLLEAGAPASPLLHWARTSCSSRRSP